MKLIVNFIMCLISREDVAGKEQWLQSLNTPPPPTKTRPIDFVAKTLREVFGTKNYELQHPFASSYFVTALSQNITIIIEFDIILQQNLFTFHCA